MMKVQKSKLIKIIRDRRQMKLRSNTHGCELIKLMSAMSLILTVINPVFI